jgi:predicted transcriptional regulator
MFCKIKTKPMCVADIVEHIPISRAAAQNMIEKLVNKGYLKFTKQLNPKSGRTVKVYEPTGLEYIKKTRGDFYDFFSKGGEPVEKETKRPDWYNPYATVYKMLDRKRDYDNPKPKRKTVVAIGSSFSLMESM